MVLLLLLLLLVCVTGGMVESLWEGHTHTHTRGNIFWWPHKQEKKLQVMGTKDRFAPQQGLSALQTTTHNHTNTNTHTPPVQPLISTP